MSAISSGDILGLIQAGARNGTLLSSCDNEVRELMHQLDVIISTKQSEWDVKGKQLQAQLDLKDRELCVLKLKLQEKKAEVENMKLTSRSVEKEYKTKLADQESQLTHMRSELTRLNQSYEQLKTKKSKTDHTDMYKQQCRALKHEVSELREQQSLLEQQLIKKEEQLREAEMERGEKVGVLYETLKTKDELIRTLEEQVELSRSSTQFTSHQDQLAQDKIRQHMELEQVLRMELLKSKHENETLQRKLRESSDSEVIKVLEERVHKLECQLREAQHPSSPSLSHEVIDQFVEHADQLTNSKYTVLRPVANEENEFSQMLEEILDKHFNQLDTSLHTILTPHT